MDKQAKEQRYAKRTTTVVTEEIITIPDGEAVPIPVEAPQRVTKNVRVEPQPPRRPCEPCDRRRAQDDEDDVDDEE